MWTAIIASILGNFAAYFFYSENWPVTIGIFVGHVYMVALLWVLGYLRERD